MGKSASQSPWFRQHRAHSRQDPHWPGLSHVCRPGPITVVRGTQRPEAQAVTWPTLAQAQDSPSATRGKWLREGRCQTRARTPGRDRRTPASVSRRRGANGRLPHAGPGPGRAPHTVRPPRAPHATLLFSTHGRTVPTPSDSPVSADTERRPEFSSVLTLPTGAAGRSPGLGPRGQDGPSGRPSPVRSSPVRLATRLRAAGPRRPRLGCDDRAHRTQGNSFRTHASTRPLYKLCCRAEQPVEERAGPAWGRAGRGALLERHALPDLHVVAKPGVS